MSGRVVPVRRRTAGPVVSAVLVVGALSLASCSWVDEPVADPFPSASATPSPSAVSTASPTPTASKSPTASESAEEPDGSPEITAPGSDLGFGDTATVVFAPDRRLRTTLQLTVRGARRGALKDFKGFVLDDSYKRRASYYYVDVTVENVGKDDVGGSPVPLWGVNDDNTLLPAVRFTTRFRSCASTPLPERFRKGDRVRTCLVYLSPDKGGLDAVSFRPDQTFDPIEWTGPVDPVARIPKDRPSKKGTKKSPGKRR